MGKSYPRRDAVEKVTGAAKFSGDMQFPGMLYAKILRPPAHGAKLIKADVDSARKIDGIQIVKDGYFIYLPEVVASPEGAFAGRTTCDDHGHG